MKNRFDIGQPFDPRYAACGFMPDSVVARDTTIRRADGNRLNTAQKLLFAFLTRSCGRNGRCWPGIRNIAEQLGRSVRSVKHDIAVLRQVQLIGSDRRGPAAAVYYPLYHGIYEEEVQRSALQSRRLECRATSEEVQDSATASRRKAARNATQLTKARPRQNAQSIRRSTLRQEVKQWAVSNLVEDERQQLESSEVWNRWEGQYYSAPDGRFKPFRLPPEISRSWFGRAVKEGLPSIQSIRSSDTGRQVYFGVRWR
jgi:hypothetical protein